MFPFRTHITNKKTMKEDKNTMAQESSQVDAKNSNVDLKDFKTLEDTWKTVKLYRSSSGQVEVISQLEMTIDGKFRYSKSKKLLKVNTSKTYPIITYQDNKVAKSFTVHLSVASTFSKKIPDCPNMVVDHIDGNVNNYNLNNLRFVTTAENNKNKSHYDVDIVLFYVSDNGEIISLFSKKKKERASFRNDCLKLGKVVNSTTKSDFSRLKNMLSLVNTLEWKLISNNSNYELSSVGLLRRELKNGGYHYTFGSKNSQGYYRVTIPGVRYTLVHSLVAKLFLLDGKDLEKGMTVDHIDTDPLNNSVSNLRVVTQKENVNNIKTREHLSKEVFGTFFGEPVYFCSEKSCASILGKSRAAICRAISNGRCLDNIIGLSKLSHEKPAKERGRLVSSIEDLVSSDTKQLMNITTISELNLFIQNNKITSYDELVNLGYGFLYNKVRGYKYSDKVTYYCSQDNQEGIDD